MNDNPIILKWFEVTWVTASGRTLVRAEDEGEAKMIASEHAQLASQAPRAVIFEGGKSIHHQWFSPEGNDPMIFDVEELAEDTAAELKRDMEEG